MAKSFLFFAIKLVRSVIIGSRRLFSTFKLSLMLFTRSFSFRASGIFLDANSLSMRSSMKSRNTLFALGGVAPPTQSLAASYQPFSLTTFTTFAAMPFISFPAPAGVLICIYTLVAARPS